MHYSIIDLLGPFSEISTRASALRHDDNAGWVALFGLLVPRADLTFAVPRFSNNLVLGAGIGFRVFKAIGDSPDTASYCFALRRCGTQMSSQTNIDEKNFEASLFVKYAM